uniref:Uncharacterized protein n=1 Tax=Setaria digitata TaxID=48799 RepID=A0A915PQK8_9BILA
MIVSSVGSTRMVTERIVKGTAVEDPLRLDLAVVMSGTVFGFADVVSRETLGSPGFYARI